MPPESTRPRTRLHVVAAALVMALAVACGEGGSPTGPSGGGGGGVPPPTGTTASVVAVADIGWCGLDGTRLTGRLVQGLTGSVILAGDIAYPNGRPIDFQNCFDPFYGAFKSRLRPVPGNHDYDSNLVGYLQYFGEVAQPGGTTYYTTTEGDWLLVMLDSNLPFGPGSAQYEFARAALQARRGGCAMAVWHHPTFSSGRNGPNAYTRAMFQLLYDNGAEVVLVGHDHLYERFGPQDGQGRADAARGVRQFTVGTGGAELYPFTTLAANSEARIASWGVLRLSLRSNAYDWAFLDTNGATVDSGFSICH